MTYVRGLRLLSGWPFAEKSMKTKRIAALQCTTLFGGLATEELADIAQRVIELRLQKGEMLFLAGESARGLYVVVDGKIRAFQQNEDGREQVMHVNAAGSVLGDVPVFDDGPFPASAISEAETHVLLLEKNDVRELCAKYPSLALAALKLMAAKVRRHASLIEALSLHEVGQRLALFLLAEARSATLAPDVTETISSSPLQPRDRKSNRFGKRRGVAGSYSTQTRRAYFFRQSHSNDPEFAGS